VLPVESNVQKQKFHAKIVVAALKETQLGQKQDWRNGGMPWRKLLAHVQLTVESVHRSQH